MVPLTKTCERVTAARVWESSRGEGGANRKGRTNVARPILIAAAIVSLAWSPVGAQTEHDGRRPSEQRVVIVGPTLKIQETPRPLEAQSHPALTVAVCARGRTSCDSICRGTVVAAANGPCSVSSYTGWCRGQRGNTCCVCAPSTGAPLASQEVPVR